MAFIGCSERPIFDIVRNVMLQQVSCTFWNGYRANFLIEQTFQT